VEPYALTGSTFDFTGDPIDFLKATYDTSGGGGFEDTPNRELRVNQGRWVSADPAGLAAVDPANPQTWNRYAYVGNNPLSYIDPLGLYLQGCPPNCGGGSTGGVTDGDLPIFFLPLSQGGICAGRGCVVPPGPPPRIVVNTTVEVTAANNGNCGSTVLPRSIGVSYGANADAGAGYEGISGTGSAGWGLFYNGNTGLSTGRFAGGGATAYFFNGNVGAPKQQGQPFNFGGFAGAGPSFWVSNAGGTPQLGGPFTTWSLNVGAGLAKFSLQLSYGGGIWQASYGPPIPIVSQGTPSISISKITTKTTTTSGCH
jgi:RHS repeat-associated protein